MDLELESLLMFLEDEFNGVAGVRIRVRQRAGLIRSPDLVQDYDPESKSLHAERGIEVRAGGREYFFPAEWARGGGRAEMRKLVEEIRSWIDQ